MILRLLTPRDWPEAEALYRALTKSGAVGDRQMFETLLAHPGSTVHGCELDGRIVSMATLHILPNLTYGGRPYGLVENVVTAPDMRGRGLGRAVLADLTEAARAAGCYKLMLLTGKGRQAKGFYESAGFEADEKWGMMLRL